MLLCGCHPRQSVSHPATAAPAPTLEAPPPPPAPLEDGRLPATALPKRYTVALRIDPGQPRFSGVVTVQVELPAPTWHVVLHARDLTVVRAVARAGGAEALATATGRQERGGIVPEELVLSFARPLPAGPAELEIAYDAPFAPDLAGVYRVQEDGRWYAYTQFEANDARRAFPCFDEPGFKTPWDVTITTPAGMTAVANAPEIERATHPDGTVERRFQTTAPLPSYLVAFAVGELDVVEGQRQPVPIRAVTTHGRGAQAALALEIAAATVGRLAEYFDVAYPFPKLDLVAVPDFGLGGMENAGLITFRDVLVLADREHSTITLRRAQTAVIAHEIAHQWLGDLVTTRWWDDLWLNEGFATWAEAKVVDQLWPGFGATIDQLAETQGVMDVDALRSARAVREPVRSTGEAMESFDGLTYTKAAAVLRMLEGWVGADVFRRGVQRYLVTNAYKNAGAQDLFDAIAYVSGQPAGRFVGDFLDHPGVPQVAASVTCLPSGASRLELRQSEWRPLGEPPAAPRTWTLPVCVASDGHRPKTCFTLGPEPITRDLFARCPAWIHPNAELAGYYRFTMPPAQQLALARGARQLGTADRVGLVANAWAAVRQGEPPEGLMDVLRALDGETSRPVVDQMVNALQGVDHALVEDSARPAFRRFVAARLAGEKKRLGWTPHPGPPARDASDQALERRAVLWTMGELAEDDATLREAEGFAARWLKDPGAVPPDTAAVALGLASARAGSERLGELRAALRTARSPEDRVLSLRAMAASNDPTVVRQALELVFTDEIKLSELRHLFGGALGHRAARPVVYAWVEENWSRLRARLPGNLARGLLEVASTVCTARERDDAEAFFVPKAKEMEGTQRSLAEGLEFAGLCVALRDHSASRMTAYLYRK
jgi:aminopeptidase N